MLTNVLHRRGRRHELVVGRLHDPSCLVRVEQALAAATAAGRLRRARIARVGRPIDGYDCVDVDPDALRAATGIELVPVQPAAFRDAYLRADPARVAALDAEARATFDLAADVEEGETLLRSLRCAVALEALDAELGLQGGIMNCHVPEIRHGEAPGITPCYALGRETSRGIPWTCSGDAVTAVAMLTTTLLGGAAVYHELESLDYRTDEALIANSGEHDLRWCDPADRPALLRNHWYASDPRCGACACFGPPAGPGTLVAFTPHADEPSGFRYVVAEGELTPRRFPATGTVHGAFRFAGGSPVDAAWGRWAEAGVNHHSSATPGHLGDAVAAVARHLGVGCTRVS
jgi:L-arabinose isomerase